MVPDEPAVFCKGVTNPLSAGTGRFDTRSRQHYGKFLAAHASKYVTRPKRRGDCLAEFSDNGIADRMTVSIIDCLEPIEVERHHRNRRSVAPAALQNPSGILQKGGSVGDARKRIGARRRHAGGLAALLDQRKNEHGTAERKDDAFEINQAVQAHDRRHTVLAGRAA
jgi:hypothetical protein